jgi:ribonucleoside-diphosphate reductase alpha chain
MKLVDEKGSIIDPYRNFIAVSRYARWIEEENRRETWSETVDRYTEFMFDYASKTYGWKNDKFKEGARQSILNHEVMPSMRALMTAGPALERDHTAGYNCSFIAVDSIRAFDEAMYVLMCGTGVGFSVEQEYVSQLPAVNEHFENSDTVIVVEDSKAGWARALRELIAMLYAGQIPTWNMDKVRPAGARLKTFGGRASGPEPLADLFEFVVGIFTNAAGRKLQPIEAHDIMCKIGEVVVVGGVRRSAMISGSDLGDFDMAKAKSGKWWETEPQRRLANNSAVYNTKPSVGQFLTEWSHLWESQSGERGIFNKEGNRRHASSNGRRDGSKVAFTNPCGEILLRPNQFCNLTEVVVRDTDRLKDLKSKVATAAVLGTIQSSLTNFKYLRKVWRDNCEEERLLGVSLTGQMAHPVLNGSEGLDKAAAWLDELRELAIETNALVAKQMGINPSTAITTVKPSGTVSQLTEVSSGMHFWYSNFYIRTVRADNKDPLTVFLKEIGIPYEADLMAPETSTVFSFPIKAPENAKVGRDISAIDHLNIWKVYKKHWTEHNPSITVSVRDEEWVDVAAWIYENWEDVGGLSFLPYDDHTYQQAPYQPVSEEEYNALKAKMPAEIRWSDLALYELIDSTTGSQELACTAGNCDVVDLTSAIEISA